MEAPGRRTRRISSKPRGNHYLVLFICVVDSGDECIGPRRMHRTRRKKFLASPLEWRSSSQQLQPRQQVRSCPLHTLWPLLFFLLVLHSFAPALAQPLINSVPILCGEVGRRLPQTLLRFHTFTRLSSSVD